MHRIKYLLLVFLIIAFLAFPKNASAAKKFIPKKAASGGQSTGGGLGIPASVRYRPDKLALLLSFYNFSGIESINYSFTYTSNGLVQGVGGRVTASNDPSSVRELLFGTCSSGVCKYHENLSGTSLALTANFSNGTVAKKLYRVRTYR